MHKRLFNEALIGLSIQPDGPILIKAGDNPADPTLPDMCFVRSNGTVYLPGSSLKGVIRAHCERLARTVQKSDKPGEWLSCDPLNDKSSCSKHLENKDLSGPQAYAKSCFLCQLFGNTSLASHFRIADAYPKNPDEVRLEERNGVAIDRVFGSVAVGPFNYETAIAGEFETRLSVKNFTLAQLGLLCLTLRDLTEERVRLGFGKSRGLGVVKVRVDELTLRYPVCEANEGKLVLVGGGEIGADSQLYGVAAFPVTGNYGYAPNDHTAMPDDYSYKPDGWLGVEVSPPSRDGAPPGPGVDWHPLARACVPKWKAVVEDAN